MTRDGHGALAEAHDEFLATVATIRPALHRYCARLTGSVIEGEDIVQDTLAKAFYALAQMDEPPPLQPWLFRIAHNAALDFLKSHGRRLTDPYADLTEVAGFDDAPELFATRVALAHFLTLPVVQRSAVILKDVLGLSLDETAQTMETTIMAVKAALVRGRKRLRDGAAAQPLAATDFDARAALDRYASLFNAGDWTAVRQLVGEDCRLDLVSRSQRRGKAVGMYFERYAGLSVTLRVGVLEGRLALAAYEPGATTPAYFILLAWNDGRVVAISDFRYVPYIAVDAEFVSLP
jgi:RNA polymerase sigma factor (sigma-70 family)